MRPVSTPGLPIPGLPGLTIPGSMPGPTPGFGTPPGTFWGSTLGGVPGSMSGTVPGCGSPPPGVLPGGIMLGPGTPEPPPGGPGITPGSIPVAITRQVTERTVHLGRAAAGATTADLPLDLTEYVLRDASCMNLDVYTA